MRISDWSSDVCSSDLGARDHRIFQPAGEARPLPARKEIPQGGGPLPGRRAAHPDRSARGRRAAGNADRKSVESGKSVSVRVDLGGRRIIKKKNKETLTQQVT